MTGRSRELLLEVLLLSERYTASEVAWVRKELAKYPDAVDVGDLLQSFRKLPTKSNAGASPLEDPDEVQAKIRLFTSDLSRRRSTKDKQRILNIARRLGVPVVPGSVEEIIERIRLKLLELPTADAAKVLRAYKVPTGDADKGYVGLANFLIRKPEA